MSLLWGNESAYKAKADNDTAQMLNSITVKLLSYEYKVQTRYCIAVYDGNTPMFVLPTGAKPLAMQYSSRA